MILRGYGDIYFWDTAKRVENLQIELWTVISPGFWCDTVVRDSLFKEDPIDDGGSFVSLWGIFV